MMAERYGSCSSWADVGCALLLGRAVASSLFSSFRIGGLASNSNVRHERVIAARP